MLVGIKIYTSLSTVLVSDFVRDCDHGNPEIFSPKLYCHLHNIMFMYAKPNPTLFVFSPIFRLQTFPANGVGKQCFCSAAGDPREEMHIRFESGRHALGTQFNYITRSRSIDSTSV